MSDLPRGGWNLPPGTSDSDIERQANGSCEQCGRVLGAWNDSETLCHRCACEQAKADDE